MRHLMLIAPLLSLVLQAAPAGDPVVGKWFWSQGQTLICRADGQVEILKDKAKVREGRWVVKDAAARKYTFTWKPGDTKEEGEVSADGYTLTLVNAEGSPRRGEKLEEGN